MDLLPIFHRQVFQILPAFACHTILISSFQAPDVLLSFARKVAGAAATSEIAPLQHALGCDGRV